MKFYHYSQMLNLIKSLKSLTLFEKLLWLCSLLTVIVSFLFCVEKDFLSAKLYYDLGDYTGNSSYSSTGNNYLAAIITAQNILKDYPYTKLREDISMLILRARYDMAKASVDEKKEERMRDTIDEYYAFVNEFPESKYLPEAEKMFKDASTYVKDSSDDSDYWCEPFVNKNNL